MISKESIDPKLLNNLYLIRHGESTCNTFNRLAGKIDVPLTSLGIKQAKEGSKKCKNLIFDKVYVSPLQRAFKTAKIVLKNHTLNDENLFIDERLKERDFGNFTLENKTILQRKHGIKEYEKAVNLDSKKAKESESYRDFSNRVLDFFYEEIIPSLKDNKKVIIISHKYVIELICNVILKKPLNKKFDLRLPNAEVLEANNISYYVKKENEKLTIFKEWLILRHAWIFSLSFLIGLIFNYLNVSIEVNSNILLMLLMFATMITMARINIESSMKFFDLKDLFFTTIRYLVLPLIFVLLLFLFQIKVDDFMLIILIFLSTPTAMVALTISRSIGGFIVPSLLFTIYSSLISIIPLSLILSNYYNHNIFYIAGLCLLVTSITLLIPYIFVLLARKYKAIKTAKISEREAYLSIILISLFIIFVSSKISEVTLEDMIFVFVIAISLRAIAGFFSKNKKINSLDIYISMSYPNVFLIIVIANLLELSYMEKLATLFLIPMFLLSIFDSWYSKKFYLDSDDKRLYSILNIKKS